MVTPRRKKQNRWRVPTPSPQNPAKSSRLPVSGFALVVLIALITLGLGVASCSSPFGADTASSEGGGRGGPGGEEGRGGGRGEGGRGEGATTGGQPPVVEIFQATRSSLNENQIYIGTTEPQQQVALRAQTTAQLLSLNVDVGDSVAQGDVIGQLDATLVRSAVQEAEAELAGRQTAVAQARAELLEIQAAIDEAKAQLQQARVDAERLKSLAAEGAIAQQQAELAQTALRVAQQRLRSAEERFRTQEQAIAGAQQQVSAQRAVVNQTEKQGSFAELRAPAAGVVLSRLVEPGDLVQVGQEILTLGDLREMLVVINVTDQVRGQVTTGQVVQVQFDALPGQSLRGTVSRISPVTDPESRLIPIEIRLDQSGQSPAQPLGSGLMARVNLGAGATASVVVPQSALELAAEAASPGIREGAGGGTGNGLGAEDARDATLFTLQEKDGELTATAQPVQIGAVRNGQVEIIAGLAPGERYVVKSDRPLRPGQPLRRSLASEF